jgi:hypothetical protein
MQVARRPREVTTGCLPHSANAGIGVLEGLAVDKPSRSYAERIVVGCILGRNLCGTRTRPLGDAFLLPLSAVLPLLAILDLGRLVAAADLEVSA